GGDGHIQAVPVRHLVQLARRLEVTQLGIGQHDTLAPLQHHASCALLEPKENPLQVNSLRGRTHGTAIVTHTLHRPSIPCQENPARNDKNPFYSNHLHDSDPMTTWERGAWHRRRGMAQGRFRAINYAMKNSCLAIPQAASPCQVESTKKPAVTRAWVCLVPDPAGSCRTWNHSHSIVPGGFEVMS